MHSHIVCSGLEERVLGGAHISQQEVTAGPWKDIYSVKLFSHCSQAWVLKTGSLHYSLMQLRPRCWEWRPPLTLQFPLRMTLGWSFQSAGAAPPLRRGDIRFLTRSHTGVHECARPPASMQAGKGPLASAVHLLIPRFVAAYTRAFGSSSLNWHREVSPCRERIRRIPLGWADASCCCHGAVVRVFL